MLEGFAGAGQIPGFGDMMPCGFQRYAQERARVQPVLDDEDTSGIQSSWRVWRHVSACENRMILDSPGTRHQYFDKEFSTRPSNRLVLAGFEHVPILYERCLICTQP